MCEVLYRGSPFRSNLNTGLHHSFGHVWSMYRSSPFRSTFSTGYITALDMCEVCTAAVHSVALSARVTSQLWTCVKYVPKQSILWHFERGLHHRFGHVWGMYRSSPFRSTFNTGYITALDMSCVKYALQQSNPKHFKHGLHHSFGHVWSMYRTVHSKALSTRFTSQVWTCVKEVCTAARHSVALWTRVTSQVWTCVKYVPQQSIP